MELGLTRRNVGRLVLLAWAVALAWLARREFSSGESAATAQRTTRLGPASQYFMVMAAGHQIGQLNVAVDTLVDGVRLTELLLLDLPEGDSTHLLARNTTHSLTRSLRLRSFTRTIFGDGLSERLEAQLGADSILTLQNFEGAAAGAARARGRVPLETTTTAMIPYRAAFGGHLTVGTRFEVPLLELGLGAPRPAVVRVTAESTFVLADSATWDPATNRWIAATNDTVRAWKLEHDAPGAPTITWVDAGGAIVFQETAGGMTLVRSAFEIVRNNHRVVQPSKASAWRRTIPGMMPLVESGRTLDSTGGSRRFLLAADTTNLIPGHPKALQGGRQSIRGDTLTIARFPDPIPGPADVAAARESTGPGWETPVLDERVITAAREAVEGARTRRDTAAALTRWVARQIATDRGRQAPSTPFVVIRSGRGTPDGKARLLTTLARASGVPARVVTGLAMVPGGPFSHAWTEFWIEGWVAADPTHGQYPASTSLVRVAVGDRSRPVNLVPLVASARFLPLRTP